MVNTYYIEDSGVFESISNVWRRIFSAEAGIFSFTPGASHYERQKKLQVGFFYCRPN